ncbi:hypothetical protein ABZ464_10610 [Streptomyces sp. NPDC005820]|uniref:hypothetical protein n=1 Tax=Streptomyces sp. NPDC005820 TaxID=3157069 RepID=UPI00340DBB3C
MSLLPLLAACGGGESTSSSSAGDGSAATTGGKTSAGSSGQLDIPADASADLKKQYLVENAIAACMKKQGFTYTPEAPEDFRTGWATDGADYGLTKKFRQKYGFGYTAVAVYPDDPQVSRKAANEPSANAKYMATLTPAQKTAYEKALGGPPDPKVGQKDWTGCMGTADKEVYGGESVADRSAASASENQANAQALNGDQELVGLAQSYASCLRKDGITVTTTQPTSIGEMVKLQASASAPAGAGGAVSVEAGANGEKPEGGPSTETMSKAEALPLLTKEIELAMKDLACGKDFRAAYFPKFFKAPGSTGAG